MQILVAATSISCRRRFQRFQILKNELVKVFRREEEEEEKEGEGRQRQTLIY